MKDDTTKLAIRIKITGVCNRTCFFCHKEDGMKDIQPVLVDRLFFLNVHSIMNHYNADRIILTEGEPTTHNKLEQIISGLCAKEITLTTNGFILLNKNEWRRLKQAGLTKATFSIHEVNAYDIISTKLKHRSLDWCDKLLKNQILNLRNAIDAGLKVRVNSVVYSSNNKSEKILQMIDKKIGLDQVEFRLLNDLSNIVSSQKEISKLIRRLEASIFKKYIRAGGSDETSYYHTKSKQTFSTKTAKRTLLQSICADCSMLAQCNAGASIRIEQRKGILYVRLCILKHTSDVLIPLTVFLKNANIVELIK